MTADIWMADDTLLVEDAIIAADDNQMNDGILVGEDTQMVDSIHMANEIKKGEEPSMFRTFSFTATFCMFIKGSASSSFRSIAWPAQYKKNKY